MTQRKIEYWVIPPQADAEFVANMEQVLDLYHKPYDPDCPVVCMDEQPVQLVKETRPPMAATKNRPRRVDYEYERAGTALVRRIEFCHTPKHGSWLNIAENELSSMTRQCLRGRRIGDLGTLHAEVSAWSTDVNGTQRGVDWQMKVDDARCKLKSVYPKIIT